jgi:hypothetical protein
MNFPEFFRYQDLEDQAKAIGIENPYGYEDQELLEKIVKKETRERNQIHVVEY